jgi:hypothetical protein
MVSFSILCLIGLVGEDHHQSIQCGKYGERVILVRQGAAYNPDTSTRLCGSGLS